MPPKGKSERYFFKYLTIPKLKLKLRSGNAGNFCRTEDDKQCDIAIFEAPLAEASVKTLNKEGVSMTLTTAPDPDYPDEMIHTMKDVNIDYVELKRAIKNVLKGLKVIHAQNKSHGDIAYRNILKTFDEQKKKYKYSITDFGTLKTAKTGRVNVQQDLKDIYQVLIGLWLLSIGMPIDQAYRTALDGPDCLLYSEKGYEEQFVYVRIPNKIAQALYGQGATNACACYFPTNEDKKLIEFGKKLWNGTFKTVDEALADHWLDKTS